MSKYKFVFVIFERPCNVDQHDFTNCFMLTDSYQILRNLLLVGDVDFDNQTVIVILSTLQHKPIKEEKEEPTSPQSTKVEKSEEEVSPVSQNGVPLRKTGKD